MASFIDTRSSEMDSSSLLSKSSHRKRVPSEYVRTSSCISSQRRFYQEIGAGPNPPICLFGIPDFDEVPSILNCDYSPYRAFHRHTDQSASEFHGYEISPLFSGICISSKHLSLSLGHLPSWKLRHNVH